MADRCPRRLAIGAWLVLTAAASGALHALGGVAAVAVLLAYVVLAATAVPLVWVVGWAVVLSRTRATATNPKCSEST